MNWNRLIRWTLTLVASSKSHLCVISDMALRLSCSSEPFIRQGRKGKHYQMPAFTIPIPCWNTVKVNWRSKEVKRKLWQVSFFFLDVVNFREEFNICLSVFTLPMDYRERLHQRPDGGTRRGVCVCVFMSFLPGFLLSDGKVDFPWTLLRNCSMWYQQTDSYKRAKPELTFGKGSGG